MKLWVIWLKLVTAFLNSVLPDPMGGRRVPKSPLIISVLVDRSIWPRQLIDLAEERLRLDRLRLNGFGRLSSPVGCAAILRATRKSPVPVLH